MRIDHIPEEFRIEWPVSKVEFEPEMAEIDWGPWNKTHMVARHFYTDDWRFESTWRVPVQNLQVVLKLKYVTAPDFSIWPGYSRRLVEWQLFRSRQICGFWQYNGVTAIPSLNWTGGMDVKVLSEGIPEDSVVAVRAPAKRYLNEWLEGAIKIRDRIKPKVVLHFGNLYGSEVWDRFYQMKLGQSGKPRKKL
ncbi:MAG: DUF4417 domain-containing protein [Deltaproteobacteria bacterium]|nr:DUF4417 domain-containing protein [Deltaproteobacteria bacterium]